MIAVLRDEPVAAVFFAPMTAEAESDALVLARDVRRYGVSAVVDGRNIRLKKKFQRASDLGSFFIIVIGDGEVAKGSVQVKDLDEHVQIEVSRGVAARELAVRVLGEGAVRDVEVVWEIEAFNRERLCG